MTTSASPWPPADGVMSTDPIDPAAFPPPVGEPVAPYPVRPGDHVRITHTTTDGHTVTVGAVVAIDDTVVTLASYPTPILHAAIVRAAAC